MNLNKLRAFCYLCWEYIRLKGLSIGVKSFKLSTMQSFFHVQIATQRGSEKELLATSGIDQSIKTACQKAISELCETDLFYRLNTPMELGRSGFCAHISPEMARIGALQELLERDSFLMHILCPNLRTEVLQAGEIKVVKLQSVSNSHCVLMASKVVKATNDNQVHYIGLSAYHSSQQWQIAKEKAIAESLMIEKGFSVKRIMVVPKHFKKRNLLYQHLDASASVELGQNLKFITSGGGKLLLDKNIPVDPTIIAQRNYGSRFVVQMTCDTLIPLCFGDNWLAQKAKVEKLLKDRGLTMQYWGLHPLL